MFGSQAQAPVFTSEPVTPEGGVLAVLSVWTTRAAKLLRWVARWWVAADFRSRQVPVLVVALGVWAITARAAWQSQESATPLLRESMARIRQQRAEAAMKAAMVPPASAAAPAVARQKAQSSIATQVEEDGAKEADAAGASLPNEVLDSIRSFLGGGAAAPERVEGNARRRVWVDMKTGLYYCPGTRHYGYGGARRGKFMSQRDAEFDYFQPATGEACQ